VIVPVVVFQIADLRAEQDIQEEISLILGGIGSPQDDFGVHPCPPRRRSSHDRMVGLSPPHREDDVGSLFQNNCKVILELPRLVPPHGEPGLVIPLDQEPLQPDRP